MMWFRIKVLRFHIWMLKSKINATNSEVKRAMNDWKDAKARYHRVVDDLAKLGEELDTAQGVLQNYTLEQLE